jgi:hypothetical protein
MNDALNKLRTKMDKLAALAEHPATPAHEVDAAMARWWDLAHKARRMELGR